jgi:DNA-binding NarL/FixJ family response regulator
LAALKVLLADDQPLIRTGIRGALAGVDDLEVVGEASSQAQLLPLIARTTPDVVLLDLEMLDGGAPLVLQTIREGHPSVNVIVLSDSREPDSIMGVLEAGACGFVLKSIDPGDLAGTIRQAVRGTFYSLGGIPLREAFQTNGVAELSLREMEVLQRVAAGLSNRAIARDLWLSDQTVKFHLRKIYRKLGVSNRTEAALYAFQRGLPEFVA